MSGRGTGKHTEWRIHSPLLASRLSHRGTESTRMEEANGLSVAVSHGVQGPGVPHFSCFEFQFITIHDGNMPRKELTPKFVYH